MFQRTITQHLQSVMLNLPVSSIEVPIDDEVRDLANEYIAAEVLGVLK